MNEELKAILGDNATLSEETVNALAEAFTAKLAAQKVALGEEHQAAIATLNEEHQAAVEAARAEVQATLNESIDTAVGQILSENESKFVEADEFARMQNVFDAVKSAFESNGFTLDENVVESGLRSDLDTARDEYKSLFEQHGSVKDELQAVKDELNLAKRAIIYESMVRDLADTERERVGTLTESINFADNDEFRAGLALIVEQVVSSRADTTTDTKTPEQTLAESAEDAAAKAAAAEADRMTAIAATPASDIYKLNSADRVKWYSANKGK